MNYEILNKQFETGSSVGKARWLGYVIKRKIRLRVRVAVVSHSSTPIGRFWT